MRVEGFDFPEGLRYVPGDHLWVKPEASRVRVGLDAIAAASAGAILYVRFQPGGRRVERGRAFGSIEAGKYVGPLRAPVAGTIVETNAKAAQSPALLNRDPYGDGWLALLEPEDLERDAAAFVVGPAVEAWARADLAAFRSKGWLPR
jgi:glycine cleavage system H protein